MKIIIKNQEGKPVFTFDVETGKAEAHIPVNECAAEFLRGLETAVVVASQFAGGSTIRDILIEASPKGSSGDFVLRMGNRVELSDNSEDHSDNSEITNPYQIMGTPSANIEIMNPDQIGRTRCPDCKDGTQTLLYTRGLCTTCNGTLLVHT